jgi:hypothetical protein
MHPSGAKPPRRGGEAPTSDSRREAQDSTVGVTSTLLAGMLGIGLWLSPIAQGRLLPDAEIHHVAMLMGTA